jgi:NitT/TauT family transport system permease protein
MSVQETPSVTAIPALERGGERPVAAGALRPRSRAVRRLPVQRDWPTWALVATQIGILVAGISLWEFGARAGFIDHFFWSQPSAIAQTMGIFFTSGDAWTDISFTFRSTIFGFLLGTTAGSLLGLSFWCSGSGLFPRSRSLPL